MMATSFIGTLSMMFLDTQAGKIALTLGFGMSGGLFGCLAAVTWPRYFGRKYLGAISGMNMATMVFASAIGPAMFGLSQSVFGSYDNAVWVSSLMPLTILICSFFIKKHRDV